MATCIRSFTVVAAMLLVATNGNADEPQSEPTTQDIKSRVAEQLLNVHEMRREAATEEYGARIAELKAGRSPVNAVLQSNNRLLLASLATGAPNAAIEYDRRASEIEAFAVKNLELGTGTRQEVTQAKAARLDAILKDLLVRPASSTN